MKTCPCCGGALEFAEGAGGIALRCERCSNDWMLESSGNLRRRVSMPVGLYMGLAWLLVVAAGIMIGGLFLGGRLAGASDEVRAEAGRRILFAVLGPSSLLVASVVWYWVKRFRTAKVRAPHSGPPFPAEAVVFNLLWLAWMIGASVLFQSRVVWAVTYEQQRAAEAGQFLAYCTPLVFIGIVLFRHWKRRRLWRLEQQPGTQE